MAGMFSKEERNARREATVERLEARADKKTDKALHRLRERRAWLIQQIAMPTAKLGGASFDDDIEKSARALHYVDSAIASLTAEGAE